MATTLISGVQYSGIWNLSSQVGAKSAGTWPSPFLYLYSWGINNSGQLGLSNTTYYSSPKQVGVLTAAPSSISTSGASSFLIKGDYSLWSWGANSSGMLAQGNTTALSSPKQVGSLTNWLRISGGYTTTAIKTDGSLWSWGYNNFGTVGDGTTISRSSPVQIGALTNWSSVAQGLYHTLAIKTDGSLWSWGYSASGQLGLGNTTYYSSPKQIGSLTTWLSVSASQYTSGAIKTDGTIWMWGRNNTGQQGISSATDPITSPRQIGALTNWSKISCSGRFTLAVKTDGTLWSWGANTSGQLGMGNTTLYSSPKQVGVLTNWSQVAVSVNTSKVSALKTDGTLWGWGEGTFGNLGLGNTTSYSSPVQVGALSSWLSLTAGSYATMAVSS
jgi:alpha-tubulin suppressor-like RCC1 family protein